MKVGVLGAGAIGCYTGICLQSLGGMQVLLVGRQSLIDSMSETKELKATNSRGLNVRIPSDKMDIAVGDDSARLADCDVILVCVKGTQTVAAAKQLSSILDEGKSGQSEPKLIVSMQNGVRNAKLIREHVARRHTVLPCMVIPYKHTTNISLASCFLLLPFASFSVS
jgi:2-dehydropantoate 2-reductase